MSTNVVAQISIAREIHQAEGKKEFYYVYQHKSVVLKSRIRILSELFLHMQWMKILTFILQHFSMDFFKEMDLLYKAGSLSL